MKILLVSEGDNELGKARSDSEPNEREGALKTLVERLIGNGHDIVQEKVSNSAIRALHGSGRGIRWKEYGKRAAAWLLHAHRKEFDAVIVLIDEDGNTDRVRGMNQAQDYESVTIPRACGTAIKSFDAWMLADEQALGRALDRTIDRQPDPESISRPKDVFVSLCGGGLTDHYLIVAKESDLTVMSDRCEKSFKPFADRVRALAC